MASQAKTIADLQRRVAELEENAELFKQFMCQASYHAMFQVQYQDYINEGFFNALGMDGGRKRRRVVEDCASSN